MNEDGEFVSGDCTLLLLVCTHVRWAVIICGLGGLTSDMVKS